MKNPTAPEAFTRLREKAIITQDEYAALLSNYEYFEQHRNDIEERFYGKWVASVNRELLVGSSLVEIRQLVAIQPNNRFAYIKQIV